MNLINKAKGSKGHKNGLIIIVAYMTVEGPLAKENSEKYRILGDLLNIFKERDVVIMGDMNGHTGILGEKTNTNGIRLLEFAEASEVEILNHTLQGGVTWRDRFFESAIDYILCNHWARERIWDMHIDEDETGIFDLNTDHNVLSISYKWCMKGITEEVGSQKSLTS